MAWLRPHAANGHDPLRLTALLLAVALPAVPPAIPAFAQDACLAVERLKVSEKTGDTCRFQGAILNRCGQDVKYAIVRAVPHPERGPLPTITGTVGRFQLAPLSFEREICQQGHHVLEVEASGSLRDATGQPINPPLAPADIPTAAERINACVKTCAPPVLDRSAILAELRASYGGALDAPDAAPAIEDYVSVTLTKRQGRDRLCAATCQGATAPEQAAALAARLDSDSEKPLASAVAALAAIAARPPPAPVATHADALPERDEGPPPPARWRGKGRHKVSAGRRCRTVTRSGRCRLVLNIEPRGRSGKQKR